jgi:hypothetical protein
VSVLDAGFMGHNGEILFVGVISVTS